MIAAMAVALLVIVAVLVARGMGASPVYSQKELAQSLSKEGPKGTKTV